IVVKLPDSASLKIGGYLSTQKGTVRTLYTPNLVPGYTYSYDLEATWSDGGKDKTTTRTVQFQANKTVEVSLSESSASTVETAQEQPKKGKKKAGAKQADPQSEDKKVEAKKVDARILGK